MFYLLYYFLLYKLFYLSYKLYYFDISELKNIVDNKKNKIVFAVYGHTSFLDIIIPLKCLFILSNIKAIAHNKYKMFYPDFLKKYFYFTRKNMSTMILDTHLALFIDGTRYKKDRLRTGYIYISKNNNADICYLCIDFDKNKICCSKIIKNDKIDELYNNKIILEPLKELIKYKNISYYPEYLSDITF